MNASAPAPPDNAAERIRAIAVGLSAAGIAAATHGNNITGLDVTATSQPPGCATTEIMLDEDGYAEIRWYTNPTAPAEDVTAALARILTAITAAPAALAPAPPPGRLPHPSAAQGSRRQEPERVGAMPEAADAETVQARIQHELLGGLLAELEAEYGPLDEAQVEQASREWPDFAEE